MFTIQKIMILDDDQELAQNLANFLNRELNVQTITFFNSKDAIAALSAGPNDFCAFILDIELVDQRDTGIVVAETIRNHYHIVDKPIFFLTSYRHFGYGSLKHLHYYDFFTKDTTFDQIASSIRKAIFPTSYNQKQQNILYISGIFCTYEIDSKDVMCIEQFGREIVVTDILGVETSYRVKPCAFSSLCNQIESQDFQELQQIHRCIIINFHRIRKIAWAKNTASVTLFNSTLTKPVGKTYLEKLKIFKE